MSSESNSQRRNRARRTNPSTTDRIGFGRRADYEIKSGGGSIAGTVDFVSSKQADSLITNFLTGLNAAERRQGSSQVRGRSKPA